MQQKDSRLIQEKGTDHQRLTNIVRMGFAAVLVLGVILLTVTIHRLSEFNNSMTKIVDVHNKKMVLAFAMRDAIRQRAVSIYTMLATDDYFHRDEELMRFYAYAGEYKDLLRKLLSLGMDTREREIHQRLADAANEAQPINRKTAELLMTDGSDEEIYESVKIGLLAQKKLLDQLDELIVLQKEYAEDAVVRNREVYRLTWLFLVVLGVGVLLIGALIARLVIQYVREKSHELSNKNIELANAYQQAEEATNAKSIFLANMSHEIRTPMNGVLGMLDIIRNSDLSNKQRQYVDTAFSSSEALLTVINDILDLSKVEAGKLKLENVEFNLWRLAEEVLSLYVKEAQDKGVELICHIDTQVPQIVKSDPTRIRQILNNLISNAVKFTKKGEVVVRLGYSNEQVSSCGFYFEVKDTGMGIPQQEQSTIFETFNQGKGTSARKFGGTGLGLAISKQLAQMLGGSIGVKSSEGVGSTFWFTGKFERLEYAKNLVSHADAEEFSQAILWLKEGSVREVLEKYLRDMRITIINEAIVGDLKRDDLIDLVSKYKNILVFCDPVTVSEKSSKKSNRDIGNVLEASASKIIFIGKYSDHEGFYRERICSNNAYLMTKPISYFSLANMISAFRRENETQELKQCPSAVYSDNDEVNSKGWILLVEDNVVNQRVACALIKGFGYDVVVAENGKEAFELVKEGGFNLIFMDCQMPIMDGFEATEKIRKYEQEHHLPALPIIAMTANTLDGGKEDCLDAGMDDYFAKPLHRESLNLLLQKWLGGNNGQEERVLDACRKSSDSHVNIIKEDQVNDSEIEKHLSIQTISELKETFSSDEFKEVVKVFIRHAREKVELLGQAISHGGGDEARDIVHSLKGSSANIGAEYLCVYTTKLLHDISTGKENVLSDTVVDALKKEVDVLEDLYQAI